MECRRGYIPEDEKEFYQKSSYRKLILAQEDLFYLLERGYPIKNASVFTGNHYLLSERQRLALVRATASRVDLLSRKGKKCSEGFSGQTVYIDGFNLIITIETALSNSTLLVCMDGTIRDLAGLRGTYRIIDKTEPALALIGERLADFGIGEASFYLDAPVSNSGRLKQRILAAMEAFSFKTEVVLVPNADTVLKEKEYVVTSDAIILNHCKSWINLAALIIREKLPSSRLVDLSRVPASDGIM